MKKLIALMLATAISIGPATVAMAGSDDAYFFGSDDSELDTTEEMDDVEYYLDRMNYYTKIYTNPTVSRFTDSRLNSSFIYFAGHGNRYSVNTGEDRGICIDDRDDYKDINDNSFSRTELAILAACRTGDYRNDPEDCIAGVIENNGANCVLAWQSSPNNGVIGDYTKQFAKYVYRGNSYFDATENAQEYLIENIGVHEDSSVFDYILFGNINDTLPEVEESRSLATNENESAIENYIDEDINQHIISDDITYKAESLDFDEIEKYIRENIDREFDVDNYTVKDFGEKANGYNSVVFRKNIDGVETNCGFSVISIDNKAKLINFTKNYEEYNDVKALNTIETKSLIDYNEEEIFEKAKEADGYSYKIDEQRLIKYYDVELGKMIYEVETVYIDDEGFCFCTVNKF